MELGHPGSHSKSCSAYPVPTKSPLLRLGLLGELGGWACLSPHIFSVSSGCSANALFVGQRDRPTTLLAAGFSGSSKQWSGAHWEPWQALGPLSFGPGTWGGQVFVLSSVGQSGTRVWGGQATKALGGGSADVFGFLP